MICSIDSTVWSQSNDYYSSRCSFLHNICSLGQQNVGFIQLPVFQSNTTLSAICTHRTKLETSLLGADLDFSQQVTLSFTKDSARQSYDKRSPSQVCLVPFAGSGNKWRTSEVMQNGVLGPLPLVSVSDMVGYDAENRPNPAARAEQILDCFVKTIALLFQL